MIDLENPFLISGYIAPEYFCDRETETAQLLSYVKNGHNCAIISPRRIGKTGLVEHLFFTTGLKNKYHLFYFDIYATLNTKELVFMLGKEIFNRLKSRGKKHLERFFDFITSLRPAFKIDTASGEPSFDIGIGEINQPEFSLEEIFNYLNSSTKPCMVAIDEFQQIAKYPEKNIEALLRTHIQRCKNAGFIFLGSQRHIMQNMFFSAAKPFYQSVTPLFLQPLKMATYSEFVQAHFKQHHKRIEAKTIEYVYTLFEGYTWYLQNIFNEIFALTPKRQMVDLDFVKRTIAQKVQAYTPLFHTTLQFLSEKQKNILVAIAKEVKAEQVLSTDFIKKHFLTSASSVQSALKILLDKELVTYEEEVYSVGDKFFGMWLKNLY